MSCWQISGNGTASVKTVVDNETNSASVVDLETARCRLLDHKIKANDRGPSSASRYPEVDFMSGALPKSVSAYNDNRRSDGLSEHA